jgi:hypothetical protein
MNRADNTGSLADPTRLMGQIEQQLKEMLGIEESRVGLVPPEGATIAQGI